MGRRRNDDLDYMPTRGVRTDLKRFMNSFLAKNTVRYEIFSHVWRERNMSYLCAGRSTDREAREFLERVLLIVQEYFLPPYQFQVRVGGLYLLYAMYQIQPIIPKVKIRMTPGQWQETLFFQQQAATQNHLDVVYIFHRLLQEQAFLFCYTSTEMSIHSYVKESEDREENLADSLKEEKTAVANLFNYESLEKLSYLQDQYQQMKIGLAGPQATKPDKSLDVVQAELVEDIVVFLQSFKEKVSALSRFGQRTDIAKKPGEEEVDNTGTRRQQLKVQAYSQLGARTNKRQKLHATNTAASPTKASKGHLATTSGSPTKASKVDSSDVFGFKMPSLNRQTISLVDSSGGSSSDDSQDEDYLPTRGMIPSSLSSYKVEKSPNNTKVKESTSVAPPTAGNSQLESSLQNLDMPFIAGKDSSQTERISWTDQNLDMPVKRRGRPPRKYLNYSCLSSFMNLSDKSSGQMGQTMRSVLIMPSVLKSDQRKSIENKEKEASDVTKKVTRPPSKHFDLTGVKTITEIVVGPNINKERSAGSVSVEGEMPKLGKTGSAGNKASSTESSKDCDLTVIHSITKRVVTPDMSLLHSNKQNLDAEKPSTMVSFKNTGISSNKRNNNMESVNNGKATVALSRIRGQLSSSTSVPESKLEADKQQNKTGVQTNKENVSRNMVEVISDSDEEAAPANSSLINKVAFKWKTSKTFLKSPTLPSNQNLQDHNMAPVRKRGRPPKNASFSPDDIAGFKKSSAKSQKKNSEEGAKYELVYFPAGQHHSEVKMFGQALTSTARKTRWTSSFPQTTDKETVTMVVVGKEVGKPVVVQSQKTIEKPGTGKQQSEGSCLKFLASQPGVRPETLASQVVYPGTKVGQQGAEGSTSPAEPSSTYLRTSLAESTSRLHSYSSAANRALDTDPGKAGTSRTTREKLSIGSPASSVPSVHSLTSTSAQPHSLKINESTQLVSESSSPKKHKQPGLQPTCSKYSPKKSISQINTAKINSMAQTKLGKRKMNEQSSSIQEQSSSTKKHKSKTSAQNQKDTVVMKLAGSRSLYRRVQKVATKKESENKVAYKKVSENKEPYNKVSFTKVAHMKHSRRKH